MTEDSQQLLALLQAGDPQAAAVVHERYVARLIALARNNLSQKMARRIDPEDVVQSVYRSFFARAGAEQYTIERGGDLWRLLSAITMNKVLKQVERHRAQKRSIDQEQTLAEGDSGPELFEAIAAEPSPEHALSLVEELEDLMQRLDPFTRRVVELRLQGTSLELVARECECSERTIRRTLEKAKQVLESRLLESRG